MKQTNFSLHCTPGLGFGHVNGHPQHCLAAMSNQACALCLAAGGRQHGASCTLQQQTYIAICFCCLDVGLVSSDDQSCKTRHTVQGIALLCKKDLRSSIEPHQHSRMLKAAMLGIPSEGTIPNQPDHHCQTQLSSDHLPCGKMRTVQDAGSSNARHTI